jgi:hypothetical protein
MVAGQKIALGRTRARQTVTVLATDTTLTIEHEDGETQVVPRTTTQPVRSIKGQRPRAAASKLLSKLPELSLVRARQPLPGESAHRRVRIVQQQP